MHRSQQAQRPSLGHLLLLLSAALELPHGVGAFPFNVSKACHQAKPGRVRIAGTKAVERLTSAWQVGYMNYTECSRGVQFEIEAGGWSSGAARVCDIQLLGEGAVDIAGMRGSFFYPQAESEDGWNYNCKFGSTRSTILLQIAHEGITAITASHGVAAECIDILGGGLTVDQLRWMFSSYSMNQLLHSGLSPDAIPFSDGDDNTHLWSELHENCSKTEIVLAGVHDGKSVAYEFLTERVLKGAEERLARQNGDETTHYHELSSLTELLAFLDDHGDGIGYVQLGDQFSQELTGQSDHIAPVPFIIPKTGKLVEPTANSFKDESFPLSRAVYLALNNDPESLALTRPFLEYSFSDEGNHILQDAGFWYIDDYEKLVMETRIQTQDAVRLDDIRSSCGPNIQDLVYAGSVDTHDVARVWSEVYMLGCPINIVHEDGGDSSGLLRQCHSRQDSAVAIAGTTRDWFPHEGEEWFEGSYVHECRQGDITRSSFKVDVALDGITMIVQKGSRADECQEVLGGFTLDQLRWMFSNYDEAQLTETGWNAGALRNSDHNPSTHKWSELDERCPDEEIRIAGDVIDEGSYVSFREAVLVDHKNGENIAVDRPFGYRQSLGFEAVEYIMRNEEAIAFVGFNTWHDNLELMTAVPVQNDAGEYVVPTWQSISDGSYNPLIRYLSMHLLNDPEYLADAIPFVRFGLEHPELVTSIELVPVQGEVLEEMLSRLDHAPYNRADFTVEDDDDIEYDELWWVGVIVGGVLLVFFIAVYMYLRSREHNRYYEY